MCIDVPSDAFLFSTKTAFALQTQLHLGNTQTSLGCKSKLHFAEQNFTFGVKLPSAVKFRLTAK